LGESYLSGTEFPCLHTIDILGRVFIYLFIFVGLEYELRTWHLQNTLPLEPVHFHLVIFEMIPDWPRTTVLLISASQEARITGMSHYLPAVFFLVFFFFFAVMGPELRAYTWSHSTSPSL
jgi:hypothetical protein